MGSSPTSRKPLFCRFPKSIKETRSHSTEDSPDLEWRVASTGPLAP